MNLKKKDILNFAKSTFKFCATIGATIILHNIINSSSNKNDNPLKKIAIISGEYVLSDMLIDKIGIEAEKSWNNTVDLIETISAKKHVF